MTTLKFLSSIFEYAEQGYTQVIELPSVKVTPVAVEDLSIAPTIVAQIQRGTDIYFSPGISAIAKPDKLSADDVIGITSLWVDIDIYHPEAHKKNNLPPTVQDAIGLLPDNIPPTFIVHSGYGIHAWYLLKEAWYFDSPEEKQQAQELLTRLQVYIRQQAGTRGWHLDSTSNLDRIMRLPGTLNYKIQSCPVQSVVLESSDVRYNPSDIADALPEIDVNNGQARTRQTAFERRDTDGPAAHMLTNCAFMQHVQLNAKTISYGEWLAALTNLVRATDGIETAHKISALDTERYNEKECDKKIDEALQNMNPQNCEYIRAQLGFQGCQAGGCGVKAPNGWSLGKLPQARAVVRSISIPNPETVYSPEVLGALALIKRDCPAEYDIFYQRCKGQLNLNTLKSEIKKQKMQDAGLTVYDGVVAENETAPSLDNDQRAVNGNWLADAVPDVPLNLQLPRKSNTQTWFFRQNGVSLRRVTNTGESFNEVSYAPILITERIYNIDSGTEKAKVTFKTNQGWKSVTLPKSTLYDGKRNICLVDFGLNINGDMTRNLSKWLSSLESANDNLIPRLSGVSKIGWRNNEKEFVLPGIQSTYVIDTSSPETEGVLSSIKTAGDFGVWIETMKYLRTITKARFILAASFAASLLKILGQRTFIIHNWGDTTDGKTATLQAGMSIWGEPGKMYRTFDATKTSLEKMAELFTDLPLGINEYEVLSDNKKGEIDQLIYMICEGKGRGRANKDGSLQRTASWRTIAIMNGEQPITNFASKGGVVTRVLELAGGALKNNIRFASDIYGILAKNYGHAGQWFIKKLLECDHDELRNNYNQTRYKLRESYPDNLDAHVDAVSCIIIADWLSSKWIFGLTDDCAGAEAVKMGQEILGELVSKSESNESERAWEWLRGWVGQNDSRISGVEAKIVGDRYGYREGAKIYIIKGVLTKAMKENGFNSYKIFPHWADQGKIPFNTDKNGKRRYGQRLGWGAREEIIPIEFT